MIAGLVAVLAPEIQSAFGDAHVHVMIFVGFGQQRTHVTMFDGITTAAAEMAVHTAGGPAGSAHIFRDLDQVHIFDRKPCRRRRFLIFSGGVMANQTINFAHVVEIKIRIFPPVTDMAAGTAGPVSVQVDTEIIDGITAFADVDPLFMANGVR